MRLQEWARDLKAANQDSSSSSSFVLDERLRSMTAGAASSAGGMICGDGSRLTRGF